MKKTAILLGLMMSLFLVGCASQDASNQGLSAPAHQNFKGDIDKK